VWFRVPGVGAWKPVALCGGRTESTGVRGSGSVFGSISFEASIRSIRSDASPLADGAAAASGLCSERSVDAQSAGLSGSSNIWVSGDSAYRVRVALDGARTQRSRGDAVRKR
jgi:hypothetical protein